MGVAPQLGILSTQTLIKFAGFVVEDNNLISIEVQDSDPFQMISCGVLSLFLSSSFSLSNRYHPSRPGLLELAKRRRNSFGCPSLRSAIVFDDGLLSVPRAVCNPFTPPNRVRGI